MYQLSIFDLNKEEAKIKNPVRLIELFGGYGSQALALEKLGVNFTSHHLCEWEPDSVRSYHALHYPDNDIDYSEGLTKQQISQYLASTGISFDGVKPATVDMIMRKKEEKIRAYYNSYIVTHNLGSIVTTKGTDLGITDTDKYTYLMTYSWPCFTSDTLVFTKKGYKKINEVQVGDAVLTHTGLYKKVTNTFINGIKPTCRVVGNFGEVRCTYNHRFYVRTMVDGVLDKPVWKEAGSLTRNDYLAIPIEKNEILPKWGGVSSYVKENKYVLRDNLSAKIKTEDFWYIMGAYVANGENDLFLKITCDNQKLKAVEERVKKLFTYKIKDNSIYIDSMELTIFLKEYNSDIKNINRTIINLPCNLLQAFIEGLMQRNNKHNKYYKFTSDSKAFIYALSLCILKVYRRAYNVTEHKNGYTLVYKGTNSSNMFCDDNYCYCKFKELIPSDPDTVYDIEVEKYHSLTVQNVIVHNCQSLSVAGKMEGMKEGSGTVSSMLWEVKRLLKELHDAGKPLPQVLFAENVKQVLSKKNGNKQELDKWISFLESLGYNNYYSVLNAKNYGIPQNRERFFMFSFLDNFTYRFPEPIPLEKCSKDYLEENVDDKYFLKNEKANELLQNLANKEIIDKYCICTGNNIEPRIKDNVSTITTAKRGISKRSTESMIVEVGNLNETYKQTGRVYSEKGIVPTITTNGGGGHIPKFMTCEEPPKEFLFGAIRNRNADNPNNRKDMTNLKPRVELNKENMCNTITTVPKDTIVVEIEKES